MVGGLSISGVRNGPDRGRGRLQRGIELLRADPTMGVNQRAIIWATLPLMTIEDLETSLGIIHSRYRTKRLLREVHSLLQLPVPPGAPCSTCMSFTWAVSPVCCCSALPAFAPRLSVLLELRSQKKAMVKPVTRLHGWVARITGDETTSIPFTSRYERCRQDKT